ncbi:hypothetical protein [Corynebacterium glyciniphilum]|uniref:hypothetical protein n=1 Tax=Corynebacterium glyciniphilum TaxID=1404244 RepID=UPI0011AB34E4|nr:hypothetical protein [Corynebacterium glyciniphilum]
MASIDLYHDLDLDRSKSPAELAAEIDHRLRGVSWDDKAQHEQLTVAQRILGNPIKRQMYDQRLDAPQASIDVDNLRGLAYQDVEPPKSLAASTALVTDKVKSFYRTDTKPKLAGTAVAAVAVLGLVGAGVASCGSDDEESSAAGSATNSTSEDLTDQDIEDAAEENFRNFTFMEAGDEMKILTGKKYTYDDGHVERVDGGVYGLSVDNLRLVDEVEPGDPDAPSDHPDSQPVKIGTYACVDFTRRLIEPNESMNEGSTRLDDDEKFELQMSSFPNLGVVVNPVIDDKKQSDRLGRNGDSLPVEVPPGSTSQIENTGSGPAKTLDTGETSELDYGQKTETAGYCWAATGPRANKANSSEVDEPSDVTGYTVLGVPNGDNTDIEPSLEEQHGWLLPH